jgi:hypothetical protein
VQQLPEIGDGRDDDDSVRERSGQVAVLQSLHVCNAFIVELQGGSEGGREERREGRREGGREEEKEFNFPRQSPANRKRCTRGGRMRLVGCAITRHARRVALTLTLRLTCRHCT